MTIEGAIVDLQNLIDNEGIPFWAKPSLQKVLETVEAEREEHLWIPVAERLPEDNVDVLIYTTDKKINKAYREYKPWVENQMEWIVFETLGYGYIYDDDKVLAWMPLPKPYKVATKLQDSCKEGSETE